LLAAGDKGALIRMPECPADGNRLERTTKVELIGDGSLRGSTEERSFGSMAARARAKYREKADFTRSIERWMGSHVPGVSLTAVQPSDNFTENMFRLAIDFAAPHYTQLMQNRLLVFRPAVVPRSDIIPLSVAERKHEILMQGQSFTEMVKIKLPAGFAMDELPAPEKVENGVGVFVTNCTAKDGEVTWTRSLDVRRQVIAAGQWAEVKSFFQRVANAESESIVLIKE